MNSPKGRLSVAKDAVLGVSWQHETVPKGRLRVAQDVVLGKSWQREQSRRDG
jgi:hypothetical protein